jgi:hypothetical protein
LIARFVGYLLVAFLNRCNEGNKIAMMGVAC